MPLAFVAASRIPVFGPPVPTIWVEGLQAQTRCVAFRPPTALLTCQPDSHASDPAGAASLVMPAAETGGRAGAVWPFPLPNDPLNAREAQRGDPRAPVVPPSPQRLPSASAAVPGLTTHTTADAAASATSALDPSWPSPAADRPPAARRSGTLGFSLSLARHEADAQQLARDAAGGRATGGGGIVFPTRGLTAAASPAQILPAGVSGRGIPGRGIPGSGVVGEADGTAGSTPPLVAAPGDPLARAAAAVAPSRGVAQAVLVTLAADVALTVAAAPATAFMDVVWIPQAVLVVVGCVLLVANLTWTPVWRRGRGRAGGLAQCVVPLVRRLFGAVAVAALLTCALALARSGALTGTVVAAPSDPAAAGWPWSGAAVYTLHRLSWVVYAHQAYRCMVETFAVRLDAGRLDRPPWG